MALQIYGGASSLLLDHFLPEVEKWIELVETGYYEAVGYTLLSWKWSFCLFTSHNITHYLPGITYAIPPAQQIMLCVKNSNVTTCRQSEYSY